MHSDESGDEVRLGLNSFIDDDLLTASKWLDLLPEWSIIRNGCEAGDPRDEGIHMIKILSPLGGVDWQWCDPEGKNLGAPLPGYAIQSSDVFLPVQVVRRGSK